MEDRERKKIKILIYSLAVFAVLVVIYFREPIGNGLKQAGISMSEKIEDMKEAYVARAIEREKARAEAEALKKVSAGNTQGPYATVSQPENDESLVEAVEISRLNGEIFVGEDSLRYIAIASLDENENEFIRNVRIPENVEQITFRAVDDTVYSNAPVKLYDSPQMDNMAFSIDEWINLRRIGISAEGIYQFVEENGDFLYADGQYFQRYSDNVDLTEMVNMPKEKVLLDITNIEQYPQLPNGCEATSLTMVLNYLGYEVTKEDISDHYLPKAPVGEAVFYDEFVGNPRDDDAYGCYAGVIVNTANDYLESVFSDYSAKDYSGATVETLLKKVKEGKPVIVWIAAHMNDEPYYTAEWLVDGEYLKWKANMHCVVLSGYDTEKNVVYINDPMSSVKNYKLDLFIKRYKQFYSQAVVIE